MRRHRILASQLPDGALHAFGIETQVVVHQIALDGVAAPGPSVAFDAVHEKLPRGEVQGVGGDLPYLIQFFIRTTEGTTSLRVIWRIFIIHEHLVVAAVFVFLNVDITEGLAAQRLTFVEEVEGLAMCFVEGLFFALAIEDMNGAFETFYFQITECLTTEVVEGSVCCCSTTTNWTLFLAC